MTMRPIDGGLFIEAGKTVKFEPGGRHLMLIGLAAPLAEGEQVRYRWRSSAPVR